ncbi:PREDICTED: uncharacterized protein LOC105147962 [Acromyrmex echinatior]|uniref:uncharacterized protein LOC105147962 n=1 Tax=Acromyrmex echinatior TaxID=103372 RepID=UPI000580C37F|nr:PREDICTED: uncharacterized protein LOC105147962 [Acromyrmex echinatior]
MEFPAMIICLLALACVRNTMSYVSRQTRQVPTTPTVSAAAAVPNTNYNNTQLPYSYPTYPIYSSNVNQMGQPAAPVMNVPQTVTTTSPPTNNTNLSDTSNNKSFLGHLKTYSLYVFQVLMTVFLSMSLINYICLQWSFCDSVLGGNSFWKNNKARRLNRSYATSNYLDDISLAVFKAVDYYNNQD